ncbi:MAG: hypothetical protein HC828_09555 [Blastochloris sp.]|nr:hypothetical protein [Blastochloris sp.]
MGLAIECYFDAPGDQAVRAVRRALTEAGIPPTLDQLGDRPHVSLTVMPQTMPHPSCRPSPRWLQPPHR